MKARDLIGYLIGLMTGKCDFDIHTVHSCHVETVVLLRGEKVDGYVDVDLDIEKLIKD